MFAKAVVRKGLKPLSKKIQVTQTQISSLLKAYKEAHQK